MPTYRSTQYTDSRTSRLLTTERKNIPKLDLSTTRTFLNMPAARDFDNNEYVKSSFMNFCQIPTVSQQSDTGKSFLEGFTKKRTAQQTSLDDSPINEYSDGSI